MFRSLALVGVALAALIGDASGAVGTRRPLMSAPTAPQPAVNLDFIAKVYVQAPNAPTGTVASVLTTVRASTSTDLMPDSPSGFAYTTYAINTARVTARGLLVEGSRINRLLISTVPATQTTGSLANGTYVLWVNGAGSATMSAGTATGCGTGVATQGVPVNFTTTGAAGTCIVTVAGALNAFQLELGNYGTSFIPTVGVILTRAADVVSVTTPPALSQALTLEVSGVPLSPNLFATNQFYLGLSDGTANERVAPIRNGITSLPGVNLIKGGVSVNPRVADEIAQFMQVSRLAASLTKDAEIVAYNGGIFRARNTTFATPTFSGLTTMQIGAQGVGTGQLFGFIHKVKIGTSPMSAGTLQAVTR